MKNEMKKLSDEKIEELLFEALKKEPEVGLPLSFAATLSKKIHARPEGFTVRMLAVFAAIVILITVSFILFVFDSETIRPLLYFIASTKYILISIIAGYLMIEYLDQKFVKKYLNNYPAHKSF
jgi:hypothetical protein